MSDVRPEPRTNKLGHRIGNRGERTRTIILTAVRDLLETRHLGEIRVADVAEASGIAASNFYTYFKTVDEAVLALCEVAALDSQGLSVHIEGDWSGSKAFEAAHACILDVLALWARHGPVLRIEHQLADKGDPAFVESRIRRLRRLHLALERRIAQARAGGYHPQGLNPRLASYEVASLLESQAAGFQLLRRADTDAAIVETSAHIIARMVTGR